MAERNLTYCWAISLISASAACRSRRPSPRDHRAINGFWAVTVALYEQAQPARLPFASGRQSRVRHFQFIAKATGPRFVCLAISQANSTTAHRPPAAMTDVTSPRERQQHSDVIADERTGNTDQCIRDVARVDPENWRRARRPGKSV